MKTPVKFVTGAYKAANLPKRGGKKALLSGTYLKSIYRVLTGSSQPFLSLAVIRSANYELFVGDSFGITSGQTSRYFFNSSHT